MMNKGRASRDIRKLIIGPPEDTRSIENEEIVRHMTDKYTKIAEPDPIAGTMTIEEFLGEDLITSCRKCPQEEYEQLVAPFTTDELKPIAEWHNPIDMEVSAFRTLTYRQRPLDSSG